ncbi:MAG TPA: DUF3987 domain-containing protein [Methylomirabilota bacterium]|nr:DUF3987 domain-containing protein [Methylomirabilota bacterium]
MAAAAVIGRKVAMRPKRQDDWAVVPNLWGLAVGPPGVMKSPALAEALRPLHRLVTDAHAQDEEQRLAQHFHLAEQQARRHALAQRLRAAVAHEASTEDLRAPFAAVSRDTPRAARRYLVNDTTVEKLGDLLNHNPNGLLLFRDELSGFLHTMERPGHENDRAFYCEAWNGTGAYTYDRIGRGTLHIRAACVSVLGGIQPGPLERYLRAVFAGRGDDGLLQRFQLAVWPDGGGRWQNVDRWPNADARARVIEVFQRLTTLEPAALGAEELTPEELPFLRFEAEAQECFDAWRGDPEAARRGGPPGPALARGEVSLADAVARVDRASDRRRGRRANRAGLARGGGTGGGLVRVSAGARAAPLRERHRPGAGGGRRARDQDHARSVGESVHRP